jgi:23S rRNA (adenine2503-C2)-methyltransferase
MQVLKKNLLGLTQDELEVFFLDLGHKKFRAKQLLQWMHQKYVVDFDLMSDLSITLRDELKSIASISLPEIISETSSNDGTVKWLFNSGVGQAIETVFIPETDRGTLCISSQVGCALDCSFCATGFQGFNRNLTSSEIISQVCFANSLLPKRKNGLSAITNVVFMGMGEPLANYRNVLKALRILLSDNAYGLSKRRVTLSTSGIVPNLNSLADECNVSLAVSLHAPEDELRDTLVPINKMHPIAELLEACWVYAKKHSNRYITFEYVMLKDINDSILHAKKLAKLLKNKPAKVNLIPFNPFSESDYQCSSSEQIRKFQSKLRELGILVTTRKTRGDDIDAACGQLAGKVNNKVLTRLSEKKRRAVVL